MSMYTLTVIWGTLFMVVLALAATRKWIASHEDDTLHLHESDAKIVRQQSWLARTLARLDLCGKSLTILVVLYGVALIARVVYLAWIESLKMQ